MNINEIMNRRDFVLGIGTSAAVGGVADAPTSDPSVNDIEKKKTHSDSAQLLSILIRAVIYQESKGDPNSINSRTGASGMMNIMPATWDKPGYGVTPGQQGQIFDPKANINFGSSLLKAFFKKYNGDIIRTLAAFNWGPGNVNNWSGNFPELPRETQKYVSRVIERMLGNRPTYKGELYVENFSGQNPLLPH